MSLNNILNKSSDQIPTWSNITCNNITVKSGISATDIAGYPIDTDTPQFEDIIQFDGFNWEFKQGSEIATNAAYLQGIPITSDTPIDNQILTFNQSDNILEYKNSIIAETIEVANTILVSSKNSLAQFQSGSTYTIPTGYSLFFTKVVDLEGGRLICDAFTTLNGNGLETSGITSTGLNPSTPLITGNGTITLNNLRIECNGGTAFSLIGDGTSTMDWFSINIYDGVFGTIQDYDNVIFSTIGLLNSHSMKFDNTGANTFGTISIANSIFNTPINETAILLPSTLIVDRRLRVIYSAVIVLGTGIGFDIADVNTFINPASFILDTVSFTTISGAQSISGMTFNDKPALWTNNTGNITNTADIGELVLTNNVTATTITNTTDYFQFAGTSVAGNFNQRFIQSDNYLTYIGGVRNIAEVKMTAAITTGNNNVVSIALIKNSDVIANSIGTSTANGSGRNEGLASFAVIEIDEGDRFTVGLRLSLIHI